MIEVIVRWKELITLSGKSIPELSIAIGKDRTYLTKLFSRAANGHFQDPGVFTTMRLASELGVRIDQLMAVDFPISALPSPDFRNAISEQSARIMSEVLKIGMQSVSGGRPDLADVLRWWHGSSGIVGVGDSIERHADLISPPESNATELSVYQMGENSLSSHVLKSSVPSDLENLVKNYPISIRKQLIAAYHSVSKHIKIDLSRIGVPIPIMDGVDQTEVVYYRLLLPVWTPDGTPLIMNYCINLEPRSIT
jgi:hypothetical protein